MGLDPVSWVLIGTTLASAAVGGGTAAYSASQQRAAARDAKKEQRKAAALAERMRARKPGTAVGAALQAQQTGASMTATSPLGVGNTGSVISPSLGGKGSLG